MVHTIITKGLLILSSRKYKFEMDGQQFVFDGERVALCTLDNLESQKNASFRHRHSIPEFRTSYLNTVALTLTNSCNLTCEYCFANQGKYDIPNLHMSYETAKKSIDLVIESVKKNNSDSIKVAFFGGEPLLAFDLIEKIVNYTNENIPPNIKVRYIITTNGTLMNPNIAQFMNKHKFEVTVSIDGNKHVHDYYRKYPNMRGSYEDVVKAINILLPKQS